MPTDKAQTGGAADARQGRGSYVVIARRYRPQSFQELVGQDQVTRALSNAIQTNRVGHAYLFTGARGIGKTSTARIFAKALNCEKGPTPAPCNVCDICRGIATGEDVDVLEIDGASNRGIDEIRQLRSNVNIRPSRARYKIYIIDEVHMLTVPAFNALLKTLEEPPEHVKFLFCTTDPEKVPITVLSRCQRFDFPPVESSSIAERLAQIVSAEGVTASDEALHLLARRAGGSLRDSQSLLEQLLAFCGSTISAADVHRLLGSASSGRLTEMVSHIIGRQAAAALQAVDRAVNEGVDPGQLAEQLLGHFRDMMAAVVGCSPELLLHNEPGEFDALQQAGRQLGLETILAVVQILDQAVMRMRQSSHVRTLLEIAVVRICSLENLDELSQVIACLREGTLPELPSAPVVVRPTVPVGQSAATGPPAASTAVQATPAPVSEPQKKNAVSVELPDEPPAARPSGQPLTAENAEQVWKQALGTLEDMTADHGSRYDRVASSAPNQLVVFFRERYTLDKERCERPERKTRIEKALQQVTGQTVRVTFELIREAAQPIAPASTPSRWQKLKQKESNQLVRHAMELFQAEITEVEEPRGSR